MRTGIEGKNRVGLAVFWISVIWMILWAVGTVPIRVPLLHTLTLEEFSQTIWAHTGPLGMLYGISIPLGAIVAGIGVLLYSGAKGSMVWKVGIGIFVGFVIALMAMALNLYSPPLFGIGGTLILLSFIGILWLWAKERMALSGSSATVADLKLVSYVFFLMAAWFI
jgi:hypothetical protein